MGFLDKIFSWMLTRDQRERHSRAIWEKSVSRAALEISLSSHAPQTAAPLQPPPPPQPQYPTPTSVSTTPFHSCPTTPSLSSSTTTTSSATSSPARSRPTTSHSTSSPRPEFRRHTSISRQPISYDELMETSHPPSPTTSTASASVSASTAAGTKYMTTITTQLLYPLPPLGPMEGVGKYRRSIHVSEKFMDRDALAALRIDEDLDSLSRGRGGNRNTTTPPVSRAASPVVVAPRRMRSLPPKWKRKVRPKRSAGPPPGLIASGKAARNARKLSASMETLLSGEE